jgi:hypothetical protein
MDMHARCASMNPSKFAMIILDGTPGPCFPEWAKSAKPDSMKGKHCIPLYWEMAYSYSNDQWYYFLSLKWWPKGANFLIEIKYHILRAIFTSSDRCGEATTLFDQFDGGSENRNNPNMCFLSEVAEHENIEVEADRLVVGHTHNVGDAHITAPRAACEAVEVHCLGDVVKAMLSASHGKKPIVVIVRDIHDWSTNYNNVKNPHLKYLTDPHQWKLTPRQNSRPAVLYKDDYSSKVWLGANGVPEGRPLELFDEKAQFPLSHPVRMPRFANPFSDSVNNSTHLAIKQLQSLYPDSAKSITSVLNSGGSDESLGLRFTREFANGHVGFPGTLATSAGTLVQVRVLADLPAKLWGWRDARGSVSVVAPSITNAVAETKVIDRPQPRKARVSQAKQAQRVSWVCACKKTYLSGEDSKRAKEHRSLNLPQCQQSSRVSPSRKRLSTAQLGAQVGANKRRMASRAEATASEGDEEQDEAAQDEGEKEDEEEEDGGEEDEEEKDEEEQDKAKIDEAEQSEALQDDNASLKEPTDCKSSNKDRKDRGMEVEERDEKEIVQVRMGSRCGHCRQELDDESEVYECTFDEKRGRKHYYCEHVFCRSCVLKHYKDMYPTQKVTSEGAWSTPKVWACPSCTGCIYLKQPYRQNCRVFYCQHCDSPFIQNEAKKRNMICFYCRLRM